LHIEEDIGGGTFGVWARNLLDPGVIAIVPSPRRWVHHLAKLKSLKELRHFLPYVVTTVKSSTVMGDAVELISSISLTFMI